MEIDSLEAPSLALSALAVIVSPVEGAGDTCTHNSTPFGRVYSDPACFFRWRAAFRADRANLPDRNDPVSICEYIGQAALEIDPARIPLSKLTAFGRSADIEIAGEYAPHLTRSSCPSSTSDLFGRSGSCTPLVALSRQRFLRPSNSYMPG